MMGDDNMTMWQFYHPENLEVTPPLPPLWEAVDTPSDTRHDACMSFSVYLRDGSCVSNPDRSVFTEMLDDLDANPSDQEHNSVSITHESEWDIEVMRGGYVIYENVEDNDQPRHMRGLDRNSVLTLMNAMASGNLDILEAQPWKPGY
jgi:hypothetical protein